MVMSEAGEEDDEWMREELAGRLDSLDVLGTGGAVEDCEGVGQSGRWWRLSKITETRGDRGSQMFGHSEFKSVHRESRIPGTIR